MGIESSISPAGACSPSPEAPAPLLYLITSAGLAVLMKRTILIAIVTSMAIGHTTVSIAINSSRFSSII